MIRTIIILTIWILQAGLFSCKAQTSSGMIDFKGIFDTWLSNRTIYSQYNDSVFLIQNYKDWAAFFKRRSVKVHQLYEEDKAIMENYDDYFRSGKHTVSLQDYVGLRNELYRDITSGKIDDPFLLMAVCDILDQEGPEVPDSMRSDNLVNALRFFSYIQMWNMGGNEEYLKKAYQCGQFLLSDEAKKYPYYDYSYSAAMRYMPRTWWLVYKLQTIPEYLDCCRRLGEFLARPDIDKLITPALKQRLQNIWETKDEALVRNTYLVDRSTMDKQQADSLMNAIIQRNLANPHLSSLSYLRTLYMQMSMGQITAKQAWEKGLERYEKIWSSAANKHLNVLQLNDFLQPFYTFFYLNYKAEIPLDVKRKTVQRMCHDIEMVYKNRKNQRANTAYVRDMLNISTYDKVTMYLTPNEVEYFLNMLNMATQPASYAHSLNSAKMTDEIVNGILKYQPELFVGVLGNNSLADVKKNKKKIAEFAHQAAVYHDIGKNSIASLMNKGHRPLMTWERKLMEAHPEFALKYLNQTPTLAQYKDIALGHHKWYNGKGGYPESFDNTKSPLRIFIDIVALADDIQDSAEKAVRSEGYPNPMIAKMEELRQGSGTQYNPNLVALIDRHQEIKDKLAWLVDEGWVKTSYEVAKTYFEKLK